MSIGIAQYMKNAVLTQDIYCVVVDAVFMARHVPFDIAIGCISRLLDSVFFIMADDYRNSLLITTHGEELLL
jgi:hypothetical protein